MKYEDRDIIIKDNISNIVKTGLDNYYGEVGFTELEGKFYMTLNCHSKDNGMEISREFFEAALKEFKEEATDD